jgi:hypothetical protein
VRDADAIQRPPLPLGLWIISALLVIGGIVFLLAVLGVRQPELTGGMLGIERSLEGRVGIGIFAAAMITAGLGMLVRIRSAWGLAMFLVMIGLAVNLYSYVSGDPNLLRLLIFVITAFYLNQRAVREVFAERNATSVA